MPQKMSMKRSRSSVGPAIVKSLFSKRPKVATQRYVKRLIARNEEIKYANVNNQIAPSTTVGIYTLANTTQGVGGGSHVGDECILKSLWLRYTMNVADISNFLRVIIFVWKPNMGYVAPSAASILKTTTNPYNLTSMYQEDGEDQYSILYDVTHCLATNGGTPYVKSETIQRKLNLQQDYITGSSNCSNNLYILLVSDSAVPSDPFITWSSRVGFTDA